MKLSKSALKRRFKFWILICFCTVLQACSVADNFRTPEERVKARSVERWQALLKGDLETAYEFLTPEYRKLTSVEQYSRTIKGVGIWKKAEVTNVACTDTCVVSLQIYARMLVPRSGESIDTNSLLREQWVQDKDSSEWFYLGPVGR